MNAPVIRSAQQVVQSLQMSEDELIDVLQSSVYPGAKLASIKMIINTCRASGKDPLKKPYHIVPMLVSNGKKNAKGYDEKEWRDVIMPGINDYRTDAARTGQHAGTSEPEFGPDVTESLGGVPITYPAWCKVTVKRQMPSGQIVEFTAVERWKENYATAGRDNDAPNSMWKRRPYAQLSKCAEAQALRKGFPEVGNQPTADEMEGKEIDMGPAMVVETPAKQMQQPAALPEYPADKFAENLATWKIAVESGRATAEQIIARSATKYSLSQAQRDAISELAAQAPIDADFVKSMEGAKHD